MELKKKDLKLTEMTVKAHWVELVSRYYLFYLGSWFKARSKVRQRLFPSQKWLGRRREEKSRWRKEKGWRSQEDVRRKKKEGSSKSMIDNLVDDK